MVLALLLVFLVANGFLLQAVAAVRNMALQHHEFELRLRDAERLRLYVQARMAEWEMQSASLKKVELACRRLELEAKESAERAARAEAKRDAACHEAAMAKLVTEKVVNTRAQIESDLAQVQRALALAEEAHQRAESEHGAAREALALAGEACKKEEEENGRLANERLALVMEVGTVKNEFVAFREKAAADRETMDAEFYSSDDARFNYGYGCCGRLTDERLALVMELRTVKDEFATFREKAAAYREIMEVEFDSRGDALFNYGYGCCIFTHNICWSKPQIPDGMLDPSLPLTPEFFTNPRCPPSILSAAPALDPTVGSEVEETSPTTAGEEANLPIGTPASSSSRIEDSIAD